MAVNVLKEGKPMYKQNQPTRFNCYRCGCEWDATEPDCVYRENHPGSYWQMPCPHCGADCRVLA